MQGQERERKEPSEFNVIVKAKDLVKHTFTITNSTERYPKKYRFTLVNRIQDKAVDIYEATLEANELDLRQADEFRQRQRLQAKALTYCKELLYALCDNVLQPRVAPSFIKDNYASQVGKGTHFGLDRLEEFMRRFYRKHGVDGWVLKCDIRKYFYSIQHDTLKGLIRKYIDDPECLWLLDMIIDSTEGNVGIPIGNQSSQIFALLYLSPLDHFIKEKLGVKFYGRYMDDFYLIHEDREYLRHCWKEIEEHVNKIGLALNEKTNIYPLKNGIDFLGFHTYISETGAVIRKVRRKSKNNVRRKLKKMRGLLEAGRITPETVEQSYKSWRGHASKGNCHHLIRNMDQYYNQLFGQAAAVAQKRGGGSASQKEERR